MVDKFINPVLLYGCDVWGFHNTYLFEKLHLKLCNSYIELESLNTKLYGNWKLGRYPLMINVKVRLLTQLLKSKSCQQNFFMC